MYCMHCGAQIDNDSEFCGVCGATVTASARAIAALPRDVREVGAQYPFEMMVAPEPKKKVPVIPIIIAVVLLLAAVGAVGYFTDWFGLTHNRVRVVSHMTQTITSNGSTQTADYSYTRNFDGVLRNVHAEVTADEETWLGTIDYSVDDDGVPTLMIVRETDTDNEYSIVIEPTKDELGRVVSMSYNVEGTPRLSATYEYEGDTDHILAITYESLSNAWLESVVSFLAVGEVAPYISYTLTNLNLGYTTSRIEFDATGHMTTYGVAGAKVSNNVPGRESRASQSLKDEADGYSYTRSYDRYGNSLHFEVTGTGSDYSQSIDSEWTMVLFPTRWIATVGRLD